MSEDYTPKRVVRSWVHADQSACWVIEIEGEPGMLYTAWGGYPSGDLSNPPRDTINEPPEHLHQSGYRMSLLAADPNRPDPF